MNPEPVHEYLSLAPPLTFRIILSPEQTAAIGVIVGFGFVLTVTVVIALAVHPPAFVPITV